MCFNSIIVNFYIGQEANTPSPNSGLLVSEDEVISIFPNIPCSANENFHEELTLKS
jgi:hypothetical protein